MAGCRFASSFAAKGSARRIAYYVVIGHLEHADLPTIDVAAEGYAREGRFLVVLFPHVRSLPEIANVLQVLDANDRRACAHVAWRKHARNDAAQIGLTWRTEHGLESSVMGFAPLGTIPVTRRSPFLGLALVARWSRERVPEGQGRPGSAWSMECTA
jgi:hypothetical protein